MERRPMVSCTKLLLPLLLLTEAVPTVVSAAEQPGAPAVHPTVTLNNGVEMPVLLWGSGGPTQENSTSTRPAVKDALLAGFPGIDTANHYHNQVGVAQGIADSGIAREQIWLQTKVEPCGNSRITPLYKGHCYNQSLAAFQQNLDQLDVDYVDLTLIHAPPCVPNSTWAAPECRWSGMPDQVYPLNTNCSDPEPCHMMQEQWRALEDMYLANKTRAIGVSNFCAPCLQCIAEHARVVPAVNQLQFHAGMPGSDPKGLMSYNSEHGIIPQAYSPLGGDAHASLLGSTAVKNIAAKYNATVGQVCLRWVLDLGYPLATSTVNTEYMAEDLVTLTQTWRFTEEETNELNALTVAPDDPVKSMCLF